MDAAQKTHTNTRTLFLIALALIAAAPGWSQTPAFSLSTSSVSFNQSVTGADVNVNSSGDPITFTVASPVYSADGGNNAWLRVTQNGATTPTSVSLSVGTVSGLGVGTFTASVKLNASAPVGVAPA